MSVRGSAIICPHAIPVHRRIPVRTTGAGSVIVAGRTIAVAFAARHAVFIIPGGASVALIVNASRLTSYRRANPINHRPVASRVGRASVDPALIIPSRAAPTALIMSIRRLTPSRRAIAANYRATAAVATTTSADIVPGSSVAGCAGAGSGAGSTV